MENDRKSIVNNHQNNLQSPSPLPLMVTRDELAQQLQVTTKTIDNLWRKGLLPRPSRIGRAVRFQRSEIVAFLEKSRAT